MFAYPTSQLDNTNVLVSLMSDFWTTIYDGKDLVYDYSRGRGEGEQQVFRDLLEWVECLDNHRVPIYNATRWHLVILRMQDQKPADPIAYGEDYVYGPQPNDGTIILYGNPRNRSVSYPAPETLRDFALATNAITRPSVVLTSGVEVFLDVTQKRLVFLDDPFLDPLIPIEVDAEGSQVIHLWLYEARLEKNYIFNHAGYVVGLEAASSKRYRELVSAVFDGLVGGTAVLQVHQALAALTGLPCIATDGEMVEIVGTDSNGQFVATDRAIYRYPFAAVITADPGDVLHAGAWPVSDVVVYEPNRGQFPTAAELAEIPLGGGLLLDSIRDDLRFPNTAVPVVSDGTVAGRFKVHFTIYGDPVDVNKFFEEFHTRGVANGKTLANVLDMRENPTTEPDISNMPATINPLQFVFETVLRHNAYIVKLRSAAFATDAPGLQHAWVLRKLIPPHCVLIVIQDGEVLIP